MRRHSKLPHLAKLPGFKGQAAMEKKEAMGKAAPGSVFKALAKKMKKVK